MTQEALKLALEFIENSECGTADLEARIKEALAQEQEPVAWMYQCTADNSEPVLLRKKQNWAESGTGLWVETALYTTPPQLTWVGLTDDDRLRLWLKTEAEDVDRYAFAKAVEAALKEKNT